MDTLTHWLTSYGALGLFILMALGIVGVPIPEETTLTLAGFLVYRDTFNLEPRFSPRLWDPWWASARAIYLAGPGSAPGHQIWQVCAPESRENRKSPCVV